MASRHITTRQLVATSSSTPLLTRACISSLAPQTSNLRERRDLYKQRQRCVPRHRKFATTSARGLQTSPASSAPSQPRVLIVGGGPAGCTTAYFLAKAGFDVTIAERSTRPPYGQGIDITNQAVDVVKRMDLLEKIKANTTGETGFALLDDAGKQVGSLLGTNDAQFENQEGGAVSLTNEIEIMRGTLNEIIADAAQHQKVQFRYGCTVTKITQQPDSATATFSDSASQESYTAIIGADGVGSNVRKLAFPPDMLQNSFHPTNTYAAYFSMALPTSEQKSYSRLQHGGRGRALWLRPIDHAGTQASGYFITTTPTSTELEALSETTTTREQQQDRLAELHADMGGIAPLVIQGMRACKDWHFSRLAQIRLPTWHIGRCALVGDAAYCPTPLTGQGTSMALMGSYILAGELAADPQNPARAFEAYKKRFDPYVKDEGVIPFGGRAQNIFVPNSTLGVQTLRFLFRGFSNGYGRKLLTMFSSDKGEAKFKLPVYSF